MRSSWFVVVLAACQAPGPAPEPGTAAMVCPADQLHDLDTHWARRDCAVDAATCRTACETDHDPGACMSLGIALEKSPVTAKDATSSYLRACELGLASGCTNYAAFLWKHNRKNAAAACAAAMFDKTCAVGDPFACGMVGRMIVDDATGPADLARGQARLEQACDKTGGFPCRVLALELEGKLGVGADQHARIEQLLVAACKAGDASACGVHATVAETFN